MCFRIDLLCSLGIFYLIVTFLGSGHVHACCHFSLVKLFVTLWTVAGQASLCMGFSRREYWSSLLFLSPGDLPNSGIEPVQFFTTDTTWEALWAYINE